MCVYIVYMCNLFHPDFKLFQRAENKNYCNSNFDITENNLMGAAEWTGYSGTTPSYSPFSSLQSTPSSYGYENSSIPEHSNFHIPTGM